MFSRYSSQNDEMVRDTYTNALEKEDSLLNKGLNNSFLNYNGCFFFQIQDYFS